MSFKPPKTFADKVRYAYANYAGFQKTVKEFNTWKYIVKNNPSFCMKYVDGQLVIYRKYYLLYNFLESFIFNANSSWREIGSLNRQGRNTIGNWIN